MTKEIKTLFENKTPMVVRLSFWQGTTVNIGGKTVEIYGSNSLKDILLESNTIIDLPKNKTTEYYVEYEDYCRIGKFDTNGWCDFVGKDRYCLCENSNFNINRTDDKKFTISSI